MLTAGEWLRMVWDAAEKRKDGNNVVKSIRPLSDSGSVHVGLWDSGSDSNARIFRA